MINRFSARLPLLVFFFAALLPRYVQAAESADVTDMLNPRAPVGLEGVELKEEESGKPKEVKRFILPPYVSETTSDTTFKTVFPLFYFKERTGEGAHKDMGVLPFYWSHDSEKATARVYFPFYWRFRTPTFKTDIVLQTYYRRSDTKYDFAIAPLLFVGSDKKEKTRYQVVLPPLYFNFVNPDGGFRMALLYYDYRDKMDFRRGFVPLYFSSKTRDRVVTTVLPPIFWHIRDEVNYTTSTILPPVFVNTREHGWSAGVIPIFYFARDKNWSRNMVMPLYYGSRVNDERTHVSPVLLSYYRKSNTLSQGGVAVFYHWYKKDGDYLHMVTPLFWSFGNTWTKEKAVLVPPLYYRKDTPVSTDRMYGLVYWNFHDHHKERTLAIAPLFAFNKSLHEKRYRTWVFPTFDFGSNPKGYHFRLHPFFYVGKDRDKNHLAIVPLIWHFADSKDRNTVVFPFWWQFKDVEHNRISRVVFPLWWQFDDKKRNVYNRVVFPLFWSFNKVEKKKHTTVVPPLYFKASDPHSARTGVLNVFVHKGENNKNPFWTFHLFPILSFGNPPAEEGTRWEFLSGFVGWRRQGHSRELKLLWIPFSIDDDGDENDKKIQEDAKKRAIDSLNGELSTAPSASLVPTKL